MRIIVFTGKGGSGSSTLAAATACSLAAAGARTLAFGLGTGLGAALAAPLTRKAARVGELLEALEGHPGLHPEDEFREWLEALLEWRGMDVQVAEDIAALPGISHVGRLLQLERYVNSGAYDAIVVDGAELAQFLDLPAALDAAARWLDNLFAPREQTVFEPFIRVFAGDYAAAGEGVLDQGRDLLGRLADLRDILTDPEVTSVRVVVSPDLSALADTQEAVSVLTLFSYVPDAILVNRLLPDAVVDPFFDGAKEEQRAVLRELEAMDPAWPILTSDLMPDAPRGTEALRALARRVYGERDASEPLAEAKEHVVERSGGEYVLAVAIPFATREQLRLEEVPEGIAVHLNGRRCVVSLPDDVSYRKPRAWTYEAHVLRVTLV